MLEIVQYFQKRFKNNSPVQSSNVISHTTLQQEHQNRHNAQASEIWGKNS